jgi:hypothetical protein
MVHQQGQHQQEQEGSFVDEADDASSSGSEEHEGTSVVNIYTGNYSIN